MQRRRPQPFFVEDVPGLDKLQIKESASVEQARPASFEIIHSSIEYSPLSQWECLTPLEVPEAMQIPLASATNKVAVARSSTTELTCFQRFIRRMETAGPQIVLDRLQKEWHVPGEEEDDEVYFGFRTHVRQRLISV
jgi:hypothetical protein